MQVRPDVPYIHSSTVAEVIRKSNSINSRASEWPQVQMLRLDGVDTGNALRIHLEHR